MPRRVVVYTAEGCRLCERALEVVREVQTELEFDLVLVDIGGDPELEARYREHLPVVEYIAPDVFAEYKRLGEDLGFSFVASGPLIRSSFNAGAAIQFLKRV